jgi:hypothetical protein
LIEIRGKKKRGREKEKEARREAVCKSGGCSFLRGCVDGRMKERAVENPISQWKMKNAANPIVNS